MDIGESIRSVSAPTASPGTMPLPNPKRARLDAAAEWARPLAGFSLGILLFESISGLWISLAGFSTFTQYTVLLHTAVGLLTVVPLLWYGVDHWKRRYRTNFNHYQLLGYVALATLLVLMVTGTALTWQAAFGGRIGPVWKQLHIVATYVFMVALGAHLATLLGRVVNNSAVKQALRRSQLACFRRTVGWSALTLGVCLMLTVLRRQPELNDSFPPGYSFKYGPDRPFAPSLARRDMSSVESRMTERILAALPLKHRKAFVAGFTVDPSQHEGLASVARQLCASLSLNDRQRRAIDDAIGEAETAFIASGAIDPRRLAGSEGCGRCHEQILREWESSAHRYASMDFVFQKVQENFAREKAPEAVRYCAGCHDPIAMFAGAKNVGNETLSVEGANEGVSCLVCHSMVQADVRGNADYTVSPPERYLFEFDEGRVPRFVSDFLIRAYPGQHSASYSRPLYKTAESCGACHKQFVDKEVNDFGWVQGQNQYDSWRKSRWHKEGDDEASIGCRECHMPLVDSTDPASGDASDRNRHSGDGKHRSHRFLGANQFIPRFHNLPGAEEHCAMTVDWLRGDYHVPEISDRWTTGPVVRLELQAPATAVPGESITIQAIVTNNKAGHDFPTGPMDMIESWVEVTVKDSAGQVIFTSSRADERGYLINPQIVFKAELIDRFGQLIGRHELWRLVGARFKRVLFPGMGDAASFSFTCPGIADSAAKAEGLSQIHVLTAPVNAEGTELQVSAVVWYCKFSAAFLDRLFGEATEMRSEVTDIARAETQIRIVHDTSATNLTSP